MDTDALERMLARGQDNVLLRLGLGSAYLARDEWDRAITHLRAAVTLDPGHAPAWKLLGKALAAAGDTSGARDAYTTGIAAAEKGGHIQAAREMRVFLKRLDRQP